MEDKRIRERVFYYSSDKKKKGKKVKLKCFCYESFNCNETLIVYSVFWNMEYVIPYEKL